MNARSKNKNAPKRKQKHPKAWRFCKSVSAIRKTECVCRPTRHATARLGRAAQTRRTVPPPRLTGGDRKTEALIAPYQIDWSQFQNVEYFSHWLTDTKGRILEVPLRKGKSDSAMIDYLTFTFGIETVYSWFPNEIIGDNEIIEYLSLVVDQIFGFGVFR